MNERPDLDPERLRQALSQIQPPPKVTERKLPVVYRHMITVDSFRRFTWTERLQILLGYNLSMIIRIKTPHNPGHFEPIIIGQVVPFKEACDELRDRIEVHLKDLKVPLP